MWAWRSKRNQLSCKEVVALVTDYLEGTLPPRVRRRFEAHLSACLSCPEYVAQIRAVALAASRPDPEAPPLPSAPQLAHLFHTLKGD